MGQLGVLSSRGCESHSDILFRARKVESWNFGLNGLATALPPLHSGRAQKTRVGLISGAGEAPFVMRPKHHPTLQI